jgi:YHS domain-containing protein
VSGEQQHTFLFADLAGFTALTEAHGDEEAADLAGEFVDAIRALLLHAATAEAERSAAGLPIDPVCRMAVDPDHSAGTLRHDETQYFFCSLACARAFANDPDRYAAVRTVPPRSP